MVLTPSRVPKHWTTVREDRAKAAASRTRATGGSHCKGRKSRREVGPMTRGLLTAASPRLPAASVSWALQKSNTASLQGAKRSFSKGQKGGLHSFMCFFFPGVECGQKCAQAGPLRFFYRHPRFRQVGFNGHRSIRAVIRLHSCEKLLFRLF